jgi:hypothetical protein
MQMEPRKTCVRSKRLTGFFAIAACLIQTTQARRKSLWSHMDDAIGPFSVGSADEHEETILSALAKAHNFLQESGSGSTEPVSLSKGNRQLELQQNSNGNNERPIKEKGCHVHAVALAESCPTILADHQQLTQTKQSPSASVLAKTSSHPTSTTTTTSSPWIRQFLAESKNDMLLPVPMDFWLDTFNLAQLAPVIENIGLEALCEEEEHHLIQNNDEPSSVEMKNSNFPIYNQARRLILQQEQELATSINDVPVQIRIAARALYLLVHQRYSISPRGLDTIRRRLLAQPTLFGACDSCGSPLLPYGESEQYGDSERAKRYCAACNTILECHETSNVDGCAWGPSFCFLWLLTHGNEVFGGQLPDRRETNEHGSTGKKAVGSIFGYQLHHTALSFLYKEDA